MIEVEHWRDGRTIRLAESRGGTRVTLHPSENLIRPAKVPWPVPELLQKYSASLRFRGATEEDDNAAREALGYYCDLQSLNSEDAITWGFVGPLIYDEPLRLTVCRRLFDALALPSPRAASVWLWRRVPHPEKPESSGGPEIDIGLLTDEVLVLGEAKWNSPLGIRQGIAGDRTQLDLRVAYLDRLVTKSTPHLSRRVVLGIDRSGDLLQAGMTSGDAEVFNISWTDIAEFYPENLKTELLAYMGWRLAHCRRAPTSRRLSD
jgi:hypothetical protein